MHGLYLGWDAPSPGHFGFGPHTPHPSHDQPLAYTGDGPICVIAPTGSGKGRDFLLPNLLTYTGPVIALDPKGELSAVCGRARRAMGHRVAVLDPFGVTGKPSDRLNPFDLFSLPGSMLEPDAEMLAAQLGEGKRSDKDPFWFDTACGLVAGLIAHVAIKSEKPSLTGVRAMLHHEDLPYHLAVLLDKNDGLSEFVRQEFLAFLKHCSDRTRDCVLSTAITYVKSLGSASVAESLADSSFPLVDVVRGDSLDVFITVPPEKLASHRALIRLWVATLLTAVMRRRRIPERRTLFVLDEAAQLGAFDPLLTAATLLRGYGLQLVTVWQDLAQMKSRYPLDWATILNNSAAVLSFGQAHFSACREYGELLGIDPRELMAMEADRAAAAIRGEGVKQVRRMNYLRDAMFARLAEPNPYFAKDHGREM
jgi:type IV secretion system protein VirD4